MSDDEYETMSNTSMKGDEAFAKRKQGVQKNELNEQLKDYINQWRDERAKEEAELKRLKDKQAARKEIRAEQDRLQAQKKKEEEDARKKADGQVITIGNERFRCPYWDRLLETKVKQHWLKIDFKNWVDEDEEEEPGQGQDLEEMMRQMGGLGGAGGQAGGVGAAEMGDMTKKAYQRPTLDDLDIEEEEEDDMPDLE